MLEQPECICLARQLNETAAGLRIQSVVAGHTPHKFAFLGEGPASHATLLAGRRIQKAVALGPYVEIYAQGATLLLRDGVALRYLPPGTPVPAKHQLLLGLENGAHLLATVQMYGMLLACAEGTHTDSYYSAAKQTPSALSDSFTEAYFLHFCAAQPANTSAKALLATGQRIPGIGNGTLQDILLGARIHPKRKLASLPVEERRRLWWHTTGTLRAMVAAGGRDTEKDLHGNPGGYKTLLSAKTWRQPCPVCGGEIVKQAYLGGSVYFCPACQPLP